MEELGQRSYIEVRINGVYSLFAYKLQRTPRMRYSELGKKSPFLSTFAYEGRERATQMNMFLIVRT